MALGKIVLFLFIIMSILTEKQEKKFVDFYRWLYGDTSKATWTGKLPEIPESKQREHMIMWRDFLTNLLWKKNAKKIYTHRGWRKEDYLHLVFNSLWFNYWPIIKWRYWEDIEYLTLDDIENEHRKTTK